MSTDTCFLWVSISFFVAAANLGLDKDAVDWRLCCSGNLATVPLVMDSTILVCTPSRKWTERIGKTF